MRLTPLDIRHKEFARSMRGYRDLEVDEFLDDIADEFERLFNENIDYKDRLETLEEKIEQYKNIEDTLKKTLISAQQQAEEMKQNAQKESDLILRDAELKSRTIVNDSYAERQKIQRSVSALKQKQEDLRFQLRSVIESYSNILDQDDESGIEELGEADFEALPETAEAVMDKKVPSSIDVAASPEILTGEDPGQSRDADTQDDFSMAGLAEKAKVEPVLEKDAEDPFADVEMDTDERKFKW